MSGKTPTVLVERGFERRLTIAAVALKRFELQHQKLPQTLDGLVPEFLPSLPRDPMSGRPLCYRLEAPHPFSLYSVGMDGHDDGGNANSSTNRFGFWEGPDAVWPSPAPER